VGLTHARYRHPAYIEAIFDEAVNDAGYQERMRQAGIPRADMLAARAAWEQALGKLGKKELLAASEAGFVPFLCELSQSDALRRLTEFRRETIYDSVKAYRQAVTKYGVSFGSNAFSPWGSPVTGQDYDKTFSDLCDFIQPLLCYNEWHRFESIAAWGRYLALHTGIDDEPAVIQAAKNLFGLGEAICPDSLQELDTCLEGGSESVLSFSRIETKMCAQYLDKPYKLQIIYRGRGWDWDTTDQVLAEAREMGFDSFIFNGCEYLSRMPSPVIPSVLPGIGWT
jgi:hypothetical protein